MKFVLGIDFGGGSSKATLLNSNGEVVAVSQKEYQTITIGNEGREQNPKDWFDSTVYNVKNILEISKINSEDLLCICFDAATHTAVLMDENFNVIRNSIYWTDIRCTSQVEYLKENYGEEISQKFLHEVSTIWTLPELLWLKQNEPSTFNKVRKICFPKDYIRHLFTGDFYTDYIEAEGSMLFDFNMRKWDKKFLSILGIDESYLPQVISPKQIVGNITKKIATLTGLSTNTKVICGSTDTALEVYGAGAIKQGLSTIKLATAGRICVVSDKFVQDKHLINYSHVIDGLHYPGTATKSCASSIRWFRDTFSGDFYGFDNLIKDIPIGSDGLIFHPYLNGELTPYGNTKLRGSFVGLSSVHTKSHFIRAVYEGITLSLLDCKKYLESNGIKMQKAFIIGGGAKSQILKQMVADCLNIQLVSTENNDSSFGSAILAGVSVGLFNSDDEANKICSKIVGITTPNEQNNILYEKLFTKYKKIQRLLESVYND